MKEIEEVLRILNAIATVIVSWLLPQFIKDTIIKNKTLCFVTIMILVVFWQYSIITCIIFKILEGDNE